MVLAIGTLGGMGYAAWRLHASQSQYDPETFCPLDGSDRHTAVLIDASDPLSATQVKRVREYIEDLRKNLEPYEWVGLYVLNQDNLVLPQPVFSLCNPGNADQANPLYENPERIREQFESRFLRPMAEAVESLVASRLETQNTSPILEMIRAVASDRRFRSGNRRLIVISDMLQNVPQYSHYSGDYDFDSFRLNPYSENFLGVSLLMTEIEVIYLKRPSTVNLQTHGHVGFWERYFDAVDASLERVEPVL